MIKMLVGICLFVFCFFVNGFSNVHVFTVQQTSQKAVISSQLTIVKKASGKSIITPNNILYNPCLIANNFYALEEVVEEDEDTEFITFKKHSYSNIQFCFNQKAFQKAGAYHFYSPKSWQPQAPVLACTSTNQYVLFCVFRI